MSTLEFDVDISNPGQFYACLGLLSVSDSLAPGVTGWFDKRRFLISSQGISPNELVNAILGMDIIPLFDIKQALGPLIFRTGYPFLVNWWCEWKGGQWEKTALKLWAGQQTSYSIPSKLLQAAASIRVQVERNPHRLLSSTNLVTGRYGVNPSASWTALDVGYSPNEHGGDAATCPYTEILAAIGLQIAAPLSDGKSQKVYYTWTEPLPSLLAACAARGVQRGWRQGDKVTFEIISRGSYRFFSR